jgi:hypothetical protein
MNDNSAIHLNHRSFRTSERNDVDFMASFDKLLPKQTDVKSMSAH